MRRPSLVAAVALSLAACATAGSGGGGDDNPDAADDPDDPDAADLPQIDAAPMAVTLSQTTATNIVTPNTVVCASTIGDPPVTQYTLGNSFFRAFRLADHGISGQFTATRVDLGIEQAETVAGQQTITVRLLTNPAFPGGTSTQLHSQDVVVTDVVTTIIPIDLSAPVVVPAGSQLVVEIVAPPHAAANNFFFPGSNVSGETREGYIMAPDCTVATPMSYPSVDGAAVVHLVLSVSGTAP
jgi:hypothetical protein